MPKTYILVGLSGSGKSTIGNCIWNKSGSLDLIRDTPFPTSDSSMGCTRKFSSIQNATTMILDTVGFGDPSKDQNTILDEFKKALAHVKNQVNCVMFMVKKSRFSSEVVQFFELVQDRIFMGRCKYNSILVITDCDDGWISEQSNSTHLKRALQNCNNVSYEFYLRFDGRYDDEWDKQRNMLKRQRAVDDLLAFLHKQQFQKINLAHVQSFRADQQLKLLELLSLLTELIEELEKAQESRIHNARMIQELESLFRIQNEAANARAVARARKEARHSVLSAQIRYGASYRFGDTDDDDDSCLIL